MNEDQIKQIVQNEIRNFMDRHQYTFSRIPSHEHNGIDSPQLSISSLKESISLEGKSGGVLDPAILDTQKINNAYTSELDNPNYLPVLPLNTIYGFGVGTHSQFEGGNAVPGTMVFFENGLTLSGLWIKTENGWYRIAPDGTL